MDGLDGICETMRQAVRAELATAMDDLRKFVDRRISELSAEVHGATQLLDFSEANLSGQLARIHEEVARVVAAPAAETRNSGLELEAVVQTTEDAANKIMEAAEAIGILLQRRGQDATVMDAVAIHLNLIFEACAFQDLTGQRIRRAIQHLRQIETMLVGLASTAEPAATFSPPATNPDLGQCEIDRLLG